MKSFPVDKKISFIMYNQYLIPLIANALVT